MIKVLPNPYLTFVNDVESKGITAANEKTLYRELKKHIEDKVPLPFCEPAARKIIIACICGIVVEAMTTGKSIDALLDDANADTTIVVCFLKGAVPLAYDKVMQQTQLKKCMEDSLWGPLGYSCQHFGLGASVLETLGHEYEEVISAALNSSYHQRKGDVEDYHKGENKKQPLEHSFVNLFRSHLLNHCHSKISSLRFFWVSNDLWALWPVWLRDTSKNARKWCADKCADILMKSVEKDLLKGLFSEYRGGQ
jgi:hypothetical protein